MEHRKTSPTRRTWLLVALAVVVTVAASWAIWLRALASAQERRIAAIAAPMVECPAERLKVKTLVNTDVDERYEVHGCGKHSLVICGSPDFECYAVPWERTVGPNRRAR
jgi:hypothetical protein